MKKYYITRELKGDNIFNPIVVETFTEDEAYEAAQYVKLMNRTKQKHHYRILSEVVTFGLDNDRDVEDDV